MTRKGSGLVITGVIFSILFYASIAYSYYPPDPNLNYYGDADGDEYMTILDMPAHYTQADVGISLDYNTFQPNNNDQRWNNCDVDGDNLCGEGDVEDLAMIAMGWTSSIVFDSWKIVNYNSSEWNPAGEWIPFQLGVRANVGGIWSGRPGIIVKVTIVPEGSTTTGELAGRTCTPDYWGDPDQHAAAGAQCAVGVTISNWVATQEIALTEAADDPMGLQLKAHGAGTLHLMAEFPRDDRFNIPHIALSIFVKFGSHWAELGGSATGGNLLNPDAESENPSMAIDPTGAPVVAWQQKEYTSYPYPNSEEYNIYVKRWNGREWEEIGSRSAWKGGISNNIGTYAQNPSLAVDAGGAPVVAWQHGYPMPCCDVDWGKWEIYVKRWNGSEWVEIGEGSASVGGISNSSGDAENPSLALDSAGAPVVAWEDNSSGTWEVYIKKWNGSEWAEIGAGSASGSGISGSDMISSSQPSLAIDASGYPIVAWTENVREYSPYCDCDVNANEIYVKRWNGSEWVGIGVGSASGVGISNSVFAIHPSLALDINGAPIVAWGEGIGGYSEGIFIKRWDGSWNVNEWVEIGEGSATEGGGGISDYNGIQPSLTLDPYGFPVVAWAIGGNEIYIKRWNGSEWGEVTPGSASGGGLSNSGGGSTNASIAMSASGDLAVAWQSAWVINVDLWNGFDWHKIGPGSETGGISNNTGYSYTPSLVIDSADNPVVAWWDSDMGYQGVYIKRWNGSEWVEIGEGSASGDGIMVYGNPSIALDSSDNPVVATNGIYIKRWNGSEWVEIGTGSSSGGGISNTAGWSFGPSLALDSNDYPVVAWMEDLDRNEFPDEIYIKRWNGTEWVEIGEGSASGGGISNNNGVYYAFSPSLALNSNDYPVVAWEEDMSSTSEIGEIYIRRWNGSEWAEIGAGSASGGGISNNSGYSGAPSLALDSNDNPVVAWMDDASGNFEIYVKRWTGSEWVEISPGSASGGGISNTNSRSVGPSLVLDPADNPVVAWGENFANVTGRYDEIYIKRWNGSAWVEVGQGSATGGGISNNGAYSMFPSLALDSFGNPFVAWT